MFALSVSRCSTDSPFCRLCDIFPGRGKSFLKGRASGETENFAKTAKASHLGEVSPKVTERARPFIKKTRRTQ